MSLIAGSGVGVKLPLLQFELNIKILLIFGDIVPYIGVICFKCPAERLGELYSKFSSLFLFVEMNPDSGMILFLVLLL
jgi:hypothetical protein